MVVGHQCLLDLESVCANVGLAGRRGTEEDSRPLTPMFCCRCSAAMPSDAQPDVTNSVSSLTYPTTRPANRRDIMMSTSTEAVKAQRQSSDFAAGSGALRVCLQTTLLLSL